MPVQHTPNISANTLSTEDLPIKAERRALRRALRRRRQSLSPRQQRAASVRLSHLLQRQPIFQRSDRIAFYLAADDEGEINPLPLLEAAWAQGKQCYLPVLQPRRTYRLWFVRFEPHTPLQRNYFGLLEPRMAGTKPIRPANLDLVLVPLVGFDRSGTRLGMGGGYYDRTFSFKNRVGTQTNPSHKPYLIGIAHSCQEVERLQREQWDVPLQAIATEQRIIACARHSSRDFR